MTTQEKRKRTVNLAELADPQMITLTGLPANRAAFKVIRSAHALDDDHQEDHDMTIDTQRRLRRRGSAAKPADAPKATRRVDTGLLSLILPEGATEADANDLVEKFGLTDDYAIRTDDEGRISLVRKDAPAAEPADTMEVALQGGLMAEIDSGVFAEVARSDKSKESTDTLRGITIRRMDFSIGEFENLEAVTAYVKDKGIDHLKDGVEQVEGGVIIHRVDPASEVQKDHGFKLQLAPGIIAHCERAETNDIPRAIRQDVTDAAFGSFGFGHLDFSSALADPQFSAMADNAIFQIFEVFDNIVFRSGLPLDDRKTLIARAADEFVGFMSTLMDSVGDMGFAQSSRKDASTSDVTTKTPEGNDEFEDKPTELDATATVRTDATETGGKDATEGTDKDGKTAAEAAARTDTDAGGAGKDKGEGDGAAAAAPVAVTRDDVVDVVKTALTEINTVFTERLDKMTELLEKTTKRVDESTQAFDGLKSKVDEIGDETVARSDDEDEGDEVPAYVHGAQAKRDDSAVFRGCLGRAGTRVPRS